MEESSYIKKTICVERGQTPLRIDKFLKSRISDVSRSRIQKAIRNNTILVNGNFVVPSYKVKPGDIVEIILPYQEERETELIPEPIPLDILYEDEHIVVINKPAGIPVHPGTGHPTGTIVNGLLYHFNKLSQKDSIRPGLVHRLDIGTTGVLLVAKDEDTHYKLAMQFFMKEVEKVYLALVWGSLNAKNLRVETFISRHPTNRKIMTVSNDLEGGKHATTIFNTLEDLFYVSLVECRPLTGRTHQIRVHLKYLLHPVFGDSDYGGDKILKGSTRGNFIKFWSEELKKLNRPLLHALSLKIRHPHTGEIMTFTAPLPDDFTKILNKWRHFLKEENVNTH